MSKVEQMAKMEPMALEVEDQPPSKKMKTEQGAIPTAGGEKQDGSKVTKEEEMEEEGGEEEEGPGKGEGEGPYAYLGRLKEEDVCITEYISDGKGVSAVIKQRYSDFIVNEVSTTGEVMHLTNTDIPVVVEPVAESEPCGPVDEVLTKEVLGLLKQVAAGSIPDTSMPAGNDKSLRLRLHRAVKTAFPNVETKTEDKDGVKVIIATLKGKAKDRRRGNEFEWPSVHHDRRFCRFTLYKENKNTMDVIHLLGKFLKVKESVFSYAGTKDKRAKTTQEVTAFKMHPKRLVGLNKFLRNITLGNFSYVEKQLKLGDLSGNHFTIVLRNVVGEDEDIEACLTSLRDVGFINYYGLQRFGSQNSSTHDIGRAILRDNWEEAVNLILAGTADTTPDTTKTADTTPDTTKTADTTPDTTKTADTTPDTTKTADTTPDTTKTADTAKSADTTKTADTTPDTTKTADTTPDTTKTADTTDTDTTSGAAEEGSKVVKGDHRRVWRETKDAKEALQRCKAQHHIERRVLHSLVRRPKDFYGALQTLSRNNRLLYPHSYQNFLWNAVTSRRIRTFGLKPMVGDLVLPSGAAAAAAAADVGEGEEQGSEEPEATKKEELPVKMSRLTPLVVDEANLSQYSIYDVVLPLPGFDVMYPANEVHSWYKELMEKDGLDIDNMRRKQKDYSLPGSYRYIMMQPRDMQWKIMRYNDVTACLALSDMDVINGVEEPQSIPDGERKALRLSFTLALSAYATMALREVLKQDTSPANQAAMNVS